MTPEKERDPQKDTAELRADYESTPLTRGEYIAAIVHLYRGELYRANTWRMRLDNTTNWAVLTSAGLLTFSFGEGQHSHWILLIGLALITVFLGFEARRFRFADVWRARVRMIEENFYSPILRRDPHSPEREWGLLVAEDLFHPRFKITRMMALRARLLRNYWALYAVLVFSWTIKVFVHPTPATSWLQIKGHLSMGLLPWWLPLAYMGTFLLSIAALLVFTPAPPIDEMEHWSEEQRAEALTPMDV